MNPRTPLIDKTVGCVAKVSACRRSGAYQFAVRTGVLSALPRHAQGAIRTAMHAHAEHRPRTPWSLITELEDLTE